MSAGPGKRALAGHHLTEALRHLSDAAAFVRELAGREESDELEHLALVVDGTRETVCDVRREIEK